MDKHYTNDPAKSRSRELVKDTIKRTLLTYRKPQDLRVLCFPGIDAQEIIEVYDALRIPRQNIIGLEREKDIAHILVQKNLGIQVIPNTLEDYITQQPSLAFDIISLDYTGPLILSQIDTFKQIREKQRRNHFILHSANLIKRDKFALEMYKYGYAVNTTVELNDSSIGPPKDYHQVCERTLNTLLHNDDADTRKEMRIEGYTKVILGCFYGSSQGLLDRLFRFYAGTEYSEFVQLLENNISQNLKRKIILNPQDPIASLAHSPLFPIMQRQLEQLLWQAHQLDCQRNRILDPTSQHLLWYAITEGAKETIFFREKDIECYTYISESGAPMIGDVIYLQSAERQASIARDMLRFIGYPHAFNIKDEYNQRRFNETFKEYNKALRRERLSSEQLFALDQKEQNRLFLGSSYKPSLTKERAIAEFKESATVDNLKTKYRNTQTLPLAQWKAHVTMGTYNSTEPQIKPQPTSLSKIEPLSIEPSDELIEHITKVDALDFLRLNIPPEEIFTIYPTSFTLGQLRAFKAHLTMGTYQN